MEYLLFNLLVIAGPLGLSMHNSNYFIREWKSFLPAIFLPMVPFVLWDVAVTGRHWWFNDLYAGTWRILGLPPGEWMFFFTVPFACLFVWHILPFAKHKKPSLVIARVSLYLLLAPAVVAYGFGLEYTGLALTALALAALLDRYLGTDIALMPRTWLFVAITLVLTFICNGYLTARPVVLYGVQYQLDFRIWTIPVEDFVYGTALLLSCTALFEYFRSSKEVH